MLARDLLILVCCLAPSSALAVPGYAQEGDGAACSPGNMFGEDACRSPVPRPWWYWWNVYHGREQHYAYLPPLPGWYYFRPYSVGQLRTQQEAVRNWGGDPRYPYSKLPTAGDDIIHWPPKLLDPRFSELRESVEAPYRRNPDGKAKPTTEDYQNMIGAAGKMRAILGTMPQDQYAEEFLNQLVSNARRLSAVSDDVANPATGPMLAKQVDVPESPSDKPVPAVSFESAAPNAASQRAQRLEEPEPPSGGTTPGMSRDSAEPIAVPPKAAACIIQWPKVLLDPRFADQRGRIEAPYRRYPAGRANLNAADCMNMIDAARQMKVLLGRIAVQISQKDCLEAAKFLDQLSAEARAKLSPKPAFQAPNKRSLAQQKSRPG